MGNRYIIYEDGHIVDTKLNKTVEPIHSSRLPGRYPTVSLETTETTISRIKPSYKRKQYRVHRLMAELFIPNPLGKRTVNHIDGNTQNNQLSNLEWATYSENSQRAYRHSYRDRRRKASSVTDTTKSIVLLTIKEYEDMELSVADISEFAQLPYSAVRYSIARLIEEGRLRKNTLYRTNSRYARFSYTVLDPDFS